MKPLLPLVLTALFSASAWAGGTAVLKNSGSSEPATLEYDGQNIRLSAALNGGPDGYLVIDGNQAYAVNIENGQPRVLDLATMGQVLGAMAGAAGQSPLQLDHMLGAVESLQPLQRNETVAGIVGQVHELVYIDDKGQRRTTEVVLSDDPRTVELAAAMLHISRTLAVTLGQPTAPLEHFKRLLLDEGRGLLRVGDDMQVVSLNEQTPAAERFVLPAAPGALPDLGKLFEQATQQAPAAAEALSDMLKALEELKKR